MATVVDFSTGKVVPAQTGPTHRARFPLEMIRRWQSREYLMEAARHDHLAAFDRWNAAWRDDDVPKEEDRLHKLADAAQAAEREAWLQLMLTPVTAHKGLQWKRGMQRRLAHQRDKWLPVLKADCERLGVDPATIIEEPDPPSSFERMAQEIQEVLDVALRLVNASDADPKLKARAVKYLSRKVSPTS